MGYKAFLEENLVKLSMPIILDESATYSDLQQEAIDRDKVKHILENRKFTEDNFATECFEEADAIRMICKYNAIGIVDDVIFQEDTFPIVGYSQRVKNELANVFQKHKLLRPNISANDLVLLLTTGQPSCKYMVPPYTTNRDLGLVLYLLLTVNAIKRNKWAAIICGSGMLLTSSGAKMQSKNLNASMNHFSNYKRTALSDKQKEIEDDVLKALSEVPISILHNKK